MKTNRTARRSAQMEKKKIYTHTLRYFVQFGGINVRTVHYVNCLFLKSFLRRGREWGVLGRVGWQGADDSGPSPRIMSQGGAASFFGKDRKIYVAKFPRY